jgi:hypothetical protein
MTASMLDEQKRVVLTAHPFQRVGAFSLCALGDVTNPEGLTTERFDTAVAQMTTDAVRAAMVSDTKAEDGFWLKTSYSFFPGSKMNHPSRLAKLDGLREEVSRWRQLPTVEAWPAADCALCGRQAVGFYGKADVALAESVAYRNTVPRGHGGLALCWACLCCFYALPYGCALTGGSSSVLHSFEDEFLRTQVFRQVRSNDRHITLGRAVTKGAFSREATALRRLRAYEDRLTAGVDLMVFSNNNREQTLAVHSLSQPIAEWLRQTQRPSQGAGFAALLRAHRTRQAPGIAALARNAFRNPARIISAAASYVSAGAEQGGAVPDDVGDLARVCRDFAGRILDVNDDDIKQVEALAANLAIVISGDTVRGPLTGLLHAAKSSAQLQALLRTMSAKWLLSPPPGSSGPLLTTRQFRLLFDPDGQSWLYRQLLTIAVLQELSERGWRPGDAKEAVEELDDETQVQAQVDDHFMSGEDGDTA